MKQPENTSSPSASTPGPETKKQPIPGPAVESRPVGAEIVPEPAPPVSKPQIESSLVGKDAATGKAAAKRPATPGQNQTASAETKKDAAAAAASPVPPVSRPEAKPDPAPAKAAPPAARPAETRRGGFLPTFLGGVVAAGLGAAACYWAIPHLPPAWQPGVVETASPEAQLDIARQAATEAATAAFEAQADAFGQRAADAGADAARQALADVTPGAAPPPAVTEKLAGLERTVADLTARLSQPSQQPAAEAAPVGVSQAALDELAARVNQQQTALEELSARPTVDPATAEQVQSLAQQAEALQQSTEAANRRALAATAAAALQAAIENAAPRDQALADLTAAGVQVPEVLAGDIPRLDQLRSEFPAAARDGLRASLDAVAADEGTMGMIGNFLRVQTGARSVEPRAGTDPDAVLSRANAAVEAGNLPDALTEIATLPQPGQQAMAAWTARAQTWVDANAALAELAAGGR